MQRERWWRQLLAAIFRTTPAYARWSSAPDPVGAPGSSVRRFPRDVVDIDRRRSDLDDLRERVERLEDRAVNSAESPEASEKESRSRDDLKWGLFTPIQWDRGDVEGSKEEMKEEFKRAARKSRRIRVELGLAEGSARASSPGLQREIRKVSESEEERVWIILPVSELELDSTEDGRSDQ